MRHIKYFLLNLHVALQNFKAGKSWVQVCLCRLWGVGSLLSLARVIPWGQELFPQMKEETGAEIKSALTRGLVRGGAKRGPSLRVSVCHSPSISFLQSYAMTFIWLLAALIYGTSCPDFAQIDSYFCIKSMKTDFHINLHISLLLCGFSSATSSSSFLKHLYLFLCLLFKNIRARVTWFRILPGFWLTQLP